MQITSDHEVVVQHLRKTRAYGKHILSVTPGDGSALISHEFIVRTVVEPGCVLESKVTFLPLIRLYKAGKSKIVDDESLVNEDIENGFDGHIGA